MVENVAIGESKNILLQWTNSEHVYKNMTGILYSAVPDTILELVV